MQRNGKSGRNAEELLKPRDAALQLGISFPTIKQWIYKNKIRSIQTAGGHHVSRGVKSTSYFSEHAAGRRKNGNRSPVASVDAIS